ncbi:hypothetical protein [Bifidobacterium magnum]|uniref:Putative phage protein gp4 n=1 Tax=Bifidobacterium magnum TaxID=1692 RepID=A0A087B685_9BIFI|nr:hypothetical protein [Bifidobacterium magnum]KFI66535.1 putative phage protein gp4 [Bifidobacterium magnum]
MTGTLEVASNALETMRSDLYKSFYEYSSSLWDQITPSDFWNDGVVEGVAAASSMAELSMVEQARHLGVSYADETLRMVGVSPKGDVDMLVYPRSNTDPWRVNLRPAAAYRDAAVKEPSLRPKTFEDEDGAAARWRESARSRLLDIADTDTHMSATDAVLNRYNRSKVLSYRRVLHPELSQSGSCGLCVVAADRWYSTSNLMPLHSRCKCGVAPAGSDYDPGFELNREDLERIYQEAGSKFGRDLMDVRVMSVNNGEIGPVLYMSDARELGRKVEHSAWVRPDRRRTREQLRKMVERANVYESKYREVLSSGKRVRFRHDGIPHVFAPSPNLKRALNSVRQMRMQAQAALQAAS